MNFTERFVHLAREFIDETNPNDLICSFAGGSVGRGEADEFSDLDLNYYVNESNIEISTNINFKEEIIQLHTHSLPDLNDIYQNPWDYRFLLEARCVRDPKLIFQELFVQSKLFFNSVEGRLLMSSQAKDVVRKRLNWLDKCILKEEWITAGLAARSSIIDAAFWLFIFYKRLFIYRQLNK